MNFWAIFPGREVEGERMGKGGGREGGRKKVRSDTPLAVCARHRDVTSSPRRYCLCQRPASRALFLTLFSSRAVQEGHPQA
jgi:hypothetical protein